MAHDVFISYSHKDKSCADAICARLESEGCRCWYAPRDIAPGAEWASAITDAIEGARAFILIFTDDANASPQVLREITMAVSHELPVIPFKLTESLPSKGMQYYLATVHWMDAIHTPQDESISRLTDRVKGVLGIGSGPVNQVETPAENPGSGGENRGRKPEKRRKNRFLAPALIALVLLLAAVILWQAGIFGNSNPGPVPTDAPAETLTETETEAAAEDPAPTEVPTETPTEVPTEAPTEVPTETPTEVPTEAPTEVPTEAPIGTLSAYTIQVSEAEPVSTVDWGGAGQVQLLEVTDQFQNSKYAARLTTTAKPEGKWVLVIFGVLDSNVNPTAMMNLGYEILRLDDYKASTSAAFGAAYDSAAGEFRLTGGLLGFFMDVPEDYDPTLGTVTVNGTAMAVSGE